MFIKGRTVDVVKSLTEDEQFHLYQKTKTLKDAIKKGDKNLTHKMIINDSDLKIYNVFLEDSTRTKESFKNAIIKNKVEKIDFDSNSSSLQKKESYIDTFNNLIGYNNYIFVVRSTEEGLCKRLQEYGAEYSIRNDLPKPLYINGGDGKHEHPTQEFLDEFTFLENNNRQRDHIHIALIGDLKFGRTVHSKVDGLKVFKNVKVDLIAPPELGMPIDYITQMEENGYDIEMYNSIQDYIKSTNIAKNWYFTRVQTERMGDDYKDKEKYLREKVTFREEFIDKVPKDAKFYHPLPRHKEKPTIPGFLDNTSLNGWEKQSSNGLYVRTALLSALYGNEYIGGDFEGESYVEKEFLDDFVGKENILKNKPSKAIESGIKAINNGIVIDHIARGDNPEDIKRHMNKIFKILNLYGEGGDRIAKSEKSDGYKGIIKLPNRDFDESQIKKISSIAPYATVNKIKNHKVVEKYRLNIPPRIYGYKEASCKNISCISHPKYKEPGTGQFFTKGKDTFVCKYCGEHHGYKEIWDQNDD